jgi:SAM-dependent methyltransferase
MTETLTRRWDRVASVIEHDSSRSYRYAKCFRYLPHVVQHDALICDVGCGEGSGLGHLRSLGYRYLMGVDVSKERLRQARSRLGHDVGLMQIETRGALPLRDSSVDVAISAAVVEHTIDPHEHIRELARIVRPGGAVIVSSDCYSYRVLQVLGIYRAAQPLDRALFPPTLVRYFNESGLQLVHSEGFPIPGEEFRFLRLIWLRIRRLVRRFRRRRAVAPRVEPAVARELPAAALDPASWRPNHWIRALPMLVFSDENVFFLLKRS